jgi:hypothetical protein
MKNNFLKYSGIVVIAIMVMVLLVIIFFNPKKETKIVEPPKVTVRSWPSPVPCYSKDGKEVDCKG